MKKLAFYMLMLVMSIGYAYAQGGADIKFDKTTHNFGTFSENNPVVSCTFTFTNVGDAPLVIHQAVASCGCTVPEYTQEPVLLRTNSFRVPGAPLQSVRLTLQLLSETYPW